MAKVLVTGGAGFIGSHVVDSLLKRGFSVVIYDNLSTGDQRFIPKSFEVEFIEAHLSDYPALESAVKGCERVFHFAAHADVRRGKENLGFNDLRGITDTHNLLVAMKRTGVKDITLSSSAVIYGEPTTIPTPETYHGPQTSTYGWSKKSCEHLIQAFSSYYGITGAIFRFVSVVGKRYSHGVVFDFVKALTQHPEYLNILGNGSQRKSFLYVDDCVEGVLMAPRIQGTVQTYNLGHDYTISVSKVAEIVVAEMGLKNVEFRYSGGERGWVGDSPIVHLDTTKISRLGWEPSITVEEGIRRTVKWLRDNPWALKRV